MEPYNRPVAQQLCLGDKMELGDAVYIFKTSLIQVLLVASPVLLVSLLVGLIVSFFQSATSIHEQTLVFIPKILAVLLVLILLGGWMISAMEQYTLHIFEMIPGMTE